MKLTAKQQLFLFFLIAALASLVGLGLWAQKWWHLRKEIFSPPAQKYPNLKYLEEKVLSETDPPASVAFNLPAIFNENVTIKKGLAIDGVKITPEAIVYRILAGPGIGVTGGTTPIITNTGVTSVQHQTGDLVLEAGAGITLEGLKINNSDPGSAQNIFKNIKIGDNILTASSNNDTLVLTAGEGITLNSVGKQIAIEAETVYDAGGGLSLQGTTFAINAPICSETEKLIWDGTVFNCLTDLDTDINNYPSALTVYGESTKTITLSRQGLPDLTAQFTDLDTDTDTNNYPSALTVSGESTKTITLSRQGLPDLTAQFTDLDTNTLYTAGTGLTLSQTVFKLGGNLDEDVALTGAGNLGLGTTSPLEKLDLAGNLKIFDPNTGRADIYTTIALDHLWTTATDFNLGTGTSGLLLPTIENELKLKPDAAASPLSGWPYRRAIILNNSGSALSNYPVLVTLNTTGIAYLSADCRDIRFTDSDGTSLLAFWQENDCPAAATKFWVKIPSLPTGTRTIYLYYGNSSASSGQNPQNVFPFFDDFNDNVLNSSLWNVVGNGTVTESGGLVNVHTAAAANASQDLISLNTFGPGVVLMFSASFSPGQSLDHKGLGFMNQNVGSGGANVTQGIYFRGQDRDFYTALNTTNYFITSYYNFAGFQNWKIEWLSNRASLYRNDSLLRQYTSGIPQSPINLRFSLYTFTSAPASPLDINIDWVLIRPYAASEPTLVSVGSEENVSGYFSGRQSWLSATLDAGENNNFQPTVFTANWLLDGTDNLPPEFQLLGSNTGSFTGEETVFPLENLVSGQEKELFNVITRGFRYWKVKVTLDTGSNLSDSPRVLDFSLKEYRPSITLSAFQKVGIGTVSPTAKLEVADSQTTLALRTETNFITFLSSTGTMVGQIVSNGSGGVTYSTSGSDFAEYFKKATEEETFEPGEVVCLNTLGLVTKCDSVNTQMIGVVSGHAGFAGNGSYANNPQYVLVGLLGQLEVKVSTESGEINPGDALTSSVNPGVAVKAKKNGQILGRALEAFTASESGKIKAYVHVSYDEVMAEVLASSIKTTPLSSPTEDVQITGNLIVSGLSNLNDVSITGKLTAGLISVNGLEGSLTVLGAPLKLQNGTVIIDLQGNITAEGEITAKKYNVIGASLGEGVLPAGQTEVEIKTSAVTEKSKIFLTPENAAVALGVTDKIPGQSFRVFLNEPLPTEIKFSWWIIN